MNETYVECLVKKKTSGFMAFLRILTIMLAVCFILVGFIFPVALIVGVILGVLAYFIYINADLEYEYLYVDKQITIDKVMAKSRRKKVCVLDLERMEAFAPVKSYHLDAFKNRTYKETDYSSGVENQPDRRYVLYYNGEKKILLEPNPEMVKAMQMAAPRKVFKD